MAKKRRADAVWSKTAKSLVFGQRLEFATHTICSSTLGLTTLLSQILDQNIDSFIKRRD